MAGLAWFKCYPKDYNEGMLGLTLEERGAYVTLLNLIYARGEPVPEDTWWITSNLGCTTKVWVKVRAALILKGKLFPCQVAGRACLMNARAADEIASFKEISQRLSEAGAKGGRKPKAALSKNNDLAEAQASEGLSQAQAIQITDTETDKDKNTPVCPDGQTAPDGADAAPVKAKTPKAPSKEAGRAKRIPDGWVVTEDLYVFGEGRGMTRREIDDAADEFCDYWRSRGDAGARKLNWDLTFKGRLRAVAARGGAFRRTLAEPDARRASTDARRDAWVSVVAKRRGEQAGPDADPRGADGGEGGGPPHLRLAYSGE